MEQDECECWRYGNGNWHTNECLKRPKGSISPHIDWREEYKKLWIHHPIAAASMSREVEKFIASEIAAEQQRVIKEIEEQVEIIIQKERFSGVPYAMNELLKFLESLKEPNDKG